MHSILPLYKKICVGLHTVCVYRYECEEIWHEFEEAVVRTTPCSVRMKDYERMFHAAPQTPPCDKVRISIRNANSCVERIVIPVSATWRTLIHRGRGGCSSSVFERQEEGGNIKRVIG